MLEIKQTDSFPKPVRNQTSSEERQQIVDALQSGKPNVIENVTKEEFGKLQQRIRNAAYKIGVKVSIISHKRDDDNVDIYFGLREV